MGSQEGDGGRTEQAPRDGQRAESAPSRALAGRAPGTKALARSLPRTLPKTTRGLVASGLVQRRAAAPTQDEPSDDAGLLTSAAAGVAGAGGPLPHADTIQTAFGAHDISGARAHVGGAAADAARGISAEAYTTGDDVAFQRSPDLHTAAHEAAHVVQQRQGITDLVGGVGRAGDRHEQHADAVADAVVAGRSAESLLGAPVTTSTGSAAVQRKEDSVDAANYVQSRLGNIHQQVWLAAERIGMVANGPYGPQLRGATFGRTLFSHIQMRSTGGIVTKSLQHFVDPESIQAIIDRSRGHDWDLSDEDHPKQKPTGPNSDTYVTPVAVEIANALARRYVESINRQFPQFLRTYMDTQGLIRATPISGPLHIKQAQLVPMHPMDSAVIEALCAAQDEIPLAALAEQRPEIRKQIDEKYAHPPMGTSGPAYAVDEPVDRPTELRFRTEDGLFHWVEAIPAGGVPGQRTATEVAKALFHGDSFSGIQRGKGVEEAYRLIPVPPLWGFHGRDIALFRQEHKDELFKRWAQTAQEIQWPLDVSSGIGAMLSVLPARQLDPIEELSAGGPQRALDSAKEADPTKAADGSKDEASVASRLQEDLDLLDSIDRILEVVGGGGDAISTARGRLMGRLSEATSTNSCMADVGAAFALADKQGSVLSDIADGVSEIGMKYAAYGRNAMAPEIRGLLDDCIKPFVAAIVALDFPDVAKTRAAAGTQRVLTFDISVQEASLHHGMTKVDNAFESGFNPDFDAAGAKVQSNLFAYDLGALRLKLANQPSQARQDLSRTASKVGDLEFDIDLGDKLVRLQQLWDAIDNEEDFWESTGDEIHGRLLKDRSSRLRLAFIEQVKLPFEAAKKANDDAGKKRARDNFKRLLEEFKPFARDVSKFIKGAERRKKWTKIVVGIAIAVVAFALGQFEFAAILAEGGTLLEASVAGGIVTTTASVALDKLLLNQDPTVGSLITGFVGNVAMFAVVGKLALAARAAGVSAEVGEATVGAAKASAAADAAGVAGKSGFAAKAANATVAFTKEMVLGEAIMLVQSETTSLIDEHRLLTKKELQETLEMGVINVIGMKVGQHAFDSAIDSFKGARAAKGIDIDGLLAERKAIKALGKQLHDAAGGDHLAKGKPPRALAQELMGRWQRYFERENQLVNDLLELSRKHPEAFKRKAASLARLREAGAADESLAHQFRAARALLGVEEVGPNLYRGDPAAMDAILAQHKASGNELVGVVTDPHTGQRKLTIDLADGSTVQIVERLPDVGHRTPPKVSVGAARFFEEWLNGFDTSTPEMATKKQRLLEYYARDPEAAMQLAADRYGFAPGELPETELLVTPDAPEKPAPGKKHGHQSQGLPEPSKGSKAYDQYAYSKEGEPKVSRFTDDQVMSRADFESMYKAGFEYDPVARQWIGGKRTTPAPGQRSFDQNGGTSVVGELPSEAVGHEVMRKLVSGEPEALRLVGIEPPPDFDSRSNEWGLGRKKDGSIVLIRGGKGAVDWSLLPEIEDVAHSHPLVDPVTGKERLITGDNGSGTIDINKLQAGAKVSDTALLDLLYLMPSTGDLSFVALGGEGGHRVHTPYVYLGEGKIGNPVAGDLHPTVEIVINGAEPVGLLYPDSEIVVYKGELQLFAGDELIKTMDIYQRYHSSGSFGMDWVTLEVPGSLAPLPADHPIAKYRSTPASGFDGVGKVAADTIAKLVASGLPNPAEHPAVKRMLKHVNAQHADTLSSLALNPRIQGFAHWLERVSKDPAQIGGALKDLERVKTILRNEPEREIAFDPAGHPMFEQTSSPPSIFDLLRDPTTLYSGATAADVPVIERVLALEPAEGARLVREYGAELTEYLRTNPLTDLAELRKALARQHTRVNERVAGFYEGIDPQNPPDGWAFTDTQFTDPGGVKVLQTKVIGPNGAEGYFERAYDPKNHEVELRMAFLKLSGQDVALPSRIGKQNAAVAMLGDKGSPTVQYVTLYQMKQLGVPLGGGDVPGAEKVHMSDIQNVETVVHLQWLRDNVGGEPSDLVEHTASVKYAETTAIQTGYERADTPLVLGGQERRIGDLMEFQERNNPSRKAENDAILAKYGYDRDTVMLWGFDIDFLLRPSK